MLRMMVNTTYNSLSAVYYFMLLCFSSNKQPALEGPEMIVLPVIAGTFIASRVGFVQDIQKLIESRKFSPSYSYQRIYLDTQQFAHCISLQSQIQAIRMQTPLGACHQHSTALHVYLCRNPNDLGMRWLVADIYSRCFLPTSRPCLVLGFTMRRQSVAQCYSSNNRFTERRTIRQVGTHC